MTHEKRAEEVVKYAATATERTQEWLREKGVIFDKWPLHPDRDRATMTREEYWQGVAFNIYTDLVQVAEKARIFLAGHKEGSAERGEWRPGNPGTDADFFLVTMVSGDIEFLHWDGGEWTERGGDNVRLEEVVAYQELPAPYTPEKGGGG